MSKRYLLLSALVAGLVAAPLASADIHGKRYGRYPTTTVRVVRTVPTDATIEARVHAQLEAMLGARADDIVVDVDDGVVFLRGSVPTESDRRMAHDAVYAANGVRGLSMGDLEASTYY